MVVEGLKGLRMTVSQPEGPPRTSSSSSHGWRHPHEALGGAGSDGNRPKPSLGSFLLTRSPPVLVPSPASLASPAAGHGRRGSRSPTHRPALVQGGLGGISLTGQRIEKPSSPPQSVSRQQQQHLEVGAGGGAAQGASGSLEEKEGGFVSSAVPSYKFPATKQRMTRQGSRPPVSDGSPEGHLKRQLLLEQQHRQPLPAASASGGDPMTKGRPSVQVLQRQVGP